MCGLDDHIPDIQLHNAQCSPWKGPHFKCKVPSSNPGWSIKDLTGKVGGAWVGLTQPLNSITDMG